MGFNNVANLYGSIFEWANNSNDLEDKDDTIRLKNIKWIDDEYLFRTKAFLITQNLPIPERLIGFKSFK